MPHAPYLRRRGTRFTFRMRMPNALTATTNRRYIERALGTSSFPVARLMAKKMAVQLDTWGNRLRAGIMTYEEIQGLVDEWLADALRFDEDRRFRDGPKPLGGGLDSEPVENLVEYERKAREALANGYWEYGCEQADMILFKTGQQMDRNSHEYRALCFECVKGQQERLAVILDRKAGNYLNPFDSRIDRASRVADATALGLASMRKPDKAPLLSELITQYLAEMKTSGHWVPQTYDERTYLLNLFLEFAGDVPVSEIDRKRVVEFRETIRKLPPAVRRSADSKDKPLAELAQAEFTKTVSTVTVNNRLTMLVAFFNWAKNTVPGFVNPASGVKIQEKKKGRESDERSVYEADDLAKVFSLLPEHGKPEQYPYRLWVPLIALFTGMRLNEICQLRCDDVGQEDGVWFFGVKDEGEGQRVKTSSSRRKVPIHPKLQELGILAYREYVRKAGENGQLFRGLTYTARSGYSRNMKNWWQKFNRTQITKDTKKNFHSFRHTISTQMKYQGVPADVAEQIVGHDAGAGERDRYAKPYPVKTLYEHLCRLEYPSVDFGPVANACKLTFHD